jgi:hypothetical protein
VRSWESIRRFSYEKALWADSRISIARDSKDKLLPRGPSDRSPSSELTLRKHLQHIWGGLTESKVLLLWPVHLAFRWHTTSRKQSFSASKRVTIHNKANRTHRPSSTLRS